MPAKLFYTKVKARSYIIYGSMWHCSYMDLRESMRGSVKGLCVQLATKLFCLESFMVYGNYGTLTACTHAHECNAKVKIHVN